MRTLIDELARQVGATPDRLALQDGETAFTFSGLNRAANRVAHAILEHRDSSQEPIGVLLGHTAEAIVALLGVTKAGQIRLPLDPHAPVDRLREILSHAGARVVVTDGAHRSALAGIEGLELVEIDSLPADLPQDDPPVEFPEGALFGLTYTSGSTGRPKAIVIGQPDALAFVEAFDDCIPLTPDDRTALIAGLSFSAARGADRALLRGASVHLFDLRTRGPAALAEWLARDRITYLVAFTSTLRALLDELPAGESLATLRWLVVSGEPLYRADVERVRAHIGPRCKIVYGYVTAELGGFSTMLTIDSKTELLDDALPAGPALPAVELTLADVSDDGVGEIVVRSPYVTLGYWREDELTDARFASDPADPGRRSFRTSDLGRLRPDGMLEVLGRIDTRVKIRGYSVDPGEVEAALGSLVEVDRAAVVAAPTRRGGNRLVAYYVPAAGASPTVNTLRSGLLARLPPYMIPAAFVPVERVPLTGNGKLDRRALPPPPSARPPLDEPYEAPRDALERTLVGIWEQVLGLRPIGIRDGFYALGGDSLAAAEAKLLIGRKLRQELPLMLFAESTATITALAQALRTRESASFRPVVPLQPDGSLPPLFCVHGAGGEILELSALAPLLGPQHPFYGLQLIGNEGDRAVRSVPRLARHYLELIRSIDPEGPYVLGGYSAGGAVAYEMAQQLRAAGTPAAAVILLDAAAPPLAEGMDAPETGEAQRPWRIRLVRLLVELHVLGRRTIPARWRHHYRLIAGRRAFDAYRPKPYAGALHLLQTRTPGRPHGLGWDALAAGGLHVAEIPGGHHSMLMPPHVEKVAEAVRSILASGIAVPRDPEPAGLSATPA